MIHFHRKYRNHWSLSKLSKFIRKLVGLENPGTLSAEGWAQHEKQSKQTAPFFNWLTNEFFDKVQDVVMFLPDCIYSVNVFYRNWKDKSHVLEGGFEVGQWVDRCTRFNTCLFYELEKFIEKEKGLDTLAWEKTLVYDESWGCEKGHENYGKSTHQALAAMEQEAIYNFWKSHKNRDLYEESGWSAICEDKYEKGDCLLNNQSQQEKEVLEKLSLLEKEYDEQETEMLIRLIKIRNYLWT